MIKRGFTLIELLVVVGIISLFASITFAFARTSRQYGNDAKRISQLEQVKTALEMYYDDNGKYPGSSENKVRWGGSWSDWWIADANGLVDLKVVLKPYISILPVTSGADVAAPFGCCAYTYFVNESGSKYDLIVSLETNNEERCEQKNWISNTGGWIGILPTFPGLNQSWCGSTMSWIPTSKYIYAVH